MSPPLEPRVEERLREIGAADLLVGIPSYNNAATIAHVVRAAAAGLAKHFPDQRAVIVNSDGGSRDGTPEVVAAVEQASAGAILARHPLSVVQKIVTPYHGVPGKGSAFRTIFEIARRLGVRACAVVDSDLRSIEPGWIELLIGPVLHEGFDYVAPHYLRHKHDGTITNSIVYPLTRALYGLELRQPIGGDFGFSGRLAAHYLARDVWDSDVARFGIDIWMTTTALAGGFRVCEAFLGAKLHDPKDPGADLAQMFVQVVSSVFDLMHVYRERWQAVDGAAPVPLFGFPHGVGLAEVRVDVARMWRIFVQGVRDLREVWEAALEPADLAALSALAGQEPRHFPDALWVRVVYGFAVAYEHARLPREQLLRSLVPLYLGRTACFVLETLHSADGDVERRIQALADEFVAQKSFLRRRWRG